MRIAERYLKIQRSSFKVIDQEDLGSGGEENASL